jgi:CubicO group peptidase (beta-lactamase class C family)
MKRDLWLAAIIVAVLPWTTPHVYPDRHKAKGAVYPDASWTFASAPASLGWSAKKLGQAAAFSKTIGSAAIMVVDRGFVVAAWGRVAHRYPLHSIRKPLVSALVGIGTAQGQIDVSKSLADLRIDDNAPQLTEVEKLATVADLLKSRSGIYHPALGEVAAMSQVKPQRGRHAPGAFWYYNNWDFNAVGTIFEQETGMGIFEAFAQWIAGPLQMQDFDIRDGKYVSGPASVHRIYAFRMSARDLARFGWLYLNNGKWRERQIVPATWVAESTATHSDLGGGRGYGYMWRTAEGGGLAPNVTLPATCFYHSGRGVHYLIVMPTLDLVIVHRVDTYLSGPYPQPHQIGRLVWMLLDARGVQGIGPDPTLEAAKNRLLAGDKLIEVLTKNRLQLAIPNGLIQGGDRTYALKFSVDGTVTLAYEPRSVVKGRWAVRDHRCCVDIDGFKDCLAVVDLQTALQFYDATETLFTTALKLAP